MNKGHHFSAWESAAENPQQMDSKNAGVFFTCVKNKEENCYFCYRCYRFVNKYKARKIEKEEKKQDESESLEHVTKNECI